MSKTPAFNPYMPFWEYVPDAEPHVFGDRVYVYGSHDRQNGTAYCQEDYVVWSAPVDDLGDWRCEGVSFRRTDDPRYAAEGGKDMMAPDCCQGPDGRFYLYYFNDMETLAVAVADGPAGPFEYLGFVHDAAGEPVGGGLAFDPGILSDESGNWLYYGFDTTVLRGKMGEEALRLAGGWVVELEDDMLTCKGEPIKVAPARVEAAGTPFEGHAFFEASSIRHIGDTFYLVYSSQLGHELCYATAPSPTGPFEYGGTIVSFVDHGYRGNDVDRAYASNTHGGLVCVKGQWYIFYHRHTHERQFSRQACAEPITIAPGGSIAQVEVTSCGLNGGPLPTRRAYPAHIFCGFRGPEGTLHISSSAHRRLSDPFLFQEGDAETGYMCMCNLREGATCTAKYFNFDGNETTCELVCRGSFEGTVDVLLLDDDENERSAGTVATSPSGEWAAFVGAVAVPRGVWGIRFALRGTGALDILSFRLF